MTHPNYIYHGMNEEQVPVNKVSENKNTPGMVIVEILKTVGSYKARERISVAWTRLEKVGKNNAETL